MFTFAKDKKKGLVQISFNFQRKICQLNALSPQTQMDEKGFLQKNSALIKGGILFLSKTFVLAIFVVSCL